MLLQEVSKSRQPNCQMQEAILAVGHPLHRLTILKTEHIIVNTRLVYMYLGTSKHLSPMTVSLPDKTNDHIHHYLSSFPIIHSAMDLASQGCSYRSIPWSVSWPFDTEYNPAEFRWRFRAVAQVQCQVRKTQNNDRVHDSMGSVGGRRINPPDCF